MPDSTPPIPPNAPVTVLARYTVELLLPPSYDRAKASALLREIDGMGFEERLQEKLAGILKRRSFGPIFTRVLS